MTLLRNFTSCGDCEEHIKQEGKIKNGKSKQKHRSNKRAKELTIIENSNKISAKRREAAMLELYKEETDENIFSGIIGALIGALIGAAIIVFLDRHGKVSSICGFLMAIFTVNGYEIEAKRNNMTGVFLSTIIIIAAVLATVHFEWTWDCYDGLIDEGYDADFVKVFKNLYSYFVEEDWIYYIKEMFIL